MHRLPLFAGVCDAFTVCRRDWQTPLLCNPAWPCAVHLDYSKCSKLCGPPSFSHQTWLAVATSVLRQQACNCRTQQHQPGLLHSSFYVLNRGTYHTITADWQHTSHLMRAADVHAVVKFKLEKEARLREFLGLLNKLNPGNGLLDIPTVKSFFLPTPATKRKTVPVSQNCRS